MTEPATPYSAVIARSCNCAVVSMVLALKLWRRPRQWAGLVGDHAAQVLVGVLGEGRRVHRGGVFGQGQGVPAECGGLHGARPEVAQAAAGRHGGGARAPDEHGDLGRRQGLSSVCRLAWEAQRGLGRLAVQDRGGGSPGC